MEGRDKSVYLQSITTSSDGHNEQPRKQKRLLCTPTLMPIFLVMVIVIVVFSSNSVTLTHYVHFAKNVRESISQKETNPSFASKGIYLPTNLKPLDFAYTSQNRLQEYETIFRPTQIRCQRLFLWLSCSGIAG
ncbi:hypothetical protein Y032_0003g1301 [Ancylostoma ceylanicum]|uniref:Uncharacterized protein n=1 Tax=Ancylostoma ceylanicum TaxID=53326 RepID=A0A016VX53_9BILA|nr:hypothetical protein Y032_0003g1301 [Ancylostoma ceylanicum]